MPQPDRPSLDLGSSLRLGELFSGPGGLASGLMEAGFKPLWAVDVDQAACHTYERNIKGHALCSPAEDIEDFRDLGEVDGLAFGFPCNDFSNVGEKKGTAGYFGQLYKQAARALQEIEPTWFIAENVPGLLSGSGRGIMHEFARAGLGYRVAIHLYRFEEYGVPQRRHRVVGVGIRDDLEITYQPPAPTTKDLKSQITAGQALRGIKRNAENHDFPKHLQTVVDRLQCIKPGENAWNAEIPEDLQLNVRGYHLSSIYRRLVHNEPAYTVTGSGGGGTHMYHWKQNRALTNRERARLQTFDDTFIFEGSKEEVRKQIGMAVPPHAAQQIGKALLKTLRGEAYEAVTPNIGICGPGGMSDGQLELIPRQSA